MEMEGYQAKKVFNIKVSKGDAVLLRGLGRQLGLDNSLLTNLLYEIAEQIDNDPMALYLMPGLLQGNMHGDGDNPYWTDDLPPEDIEPLHVVTEWDIHDVDFDISPDP